MRVGAVDWDCSVPRGTYFGNATAKSHHHRVDGPIGHGLVVALDVRDDLRARVDAARLAGEDVEQVEFAAQLESGDDIALRRFGRQHDDRRGGDRLRATDLAADGKSVEPREHEIEEHERRLLVKDERATVVPSVGLVESGRACALEREPQHRNVSV